MFSHFADATESSFHHPVLILKDWKGLSRILKKRVRDLIFALSKYQILIRPRLPISYEEDLLSLDSLQGIQHEYPLSPKEKSSGVVDLSITVVVGDTLLSSASWMMVPSCQAWIYTTRALLS